MPGARRTARPVLAVAVIGGALRRWLPACGCGCADLVAAPRSEGSRPARRRQAAVKDSYVFTTGWGEPIYPDTVTSLMTKLIRAYNKPGQGSPPKDQLPHARLHDLRHQHATTLLLSGVPVHVVAARLGHADPAITLRVYARVIRTAEAAAADIFAGAVKAA